MPKQTEKQYTDTNRQGRCRASSSRESTERPVGGEATSQTVQGGHLARADENSSIDDDNRSYRRDDSAEAMGRPRSSETKLPGNEYCDGNDDVPTVPNVIGAGPGGPRVSQLVTLKDGGHTGNGGGYRIPITPHMIVIAMQSLMKKDRELTPQAIADFIRERYPVCKSPRDFTHELVDKLQCAVSTKIILRSGNNCYALPVRRRNRVHLLRNETKAFWQRYSRIVKSKKNKVKLPSGLQAKKCSDSRTRLPTRLRTARGSRDRSGSSSSDNSRESPSEGPRTKRRKSCSSSASPCCSTMSKSSEAKNSTGIRKSARNNEDRILESSRRRDDSPSTGNNHPCATQSTSPARNGHQQSKCNNKSKDNDTRAPRAKESGTNELKPSTSSDYTLRPRKSPYPASSQSETKDNHGIAHRRESPHSKTIKYSDDTDNPSLPRKRRLSHSSSNSSPEVIKRQALSKEGSNLRPKRKTEEDSIDLSSSRRSVSSHSGSSGGSNGNQISGITSLDKSHQNTPINIPVSTTKLSSSRSCRNQDSRHNTPHRSTPKTLCNKRLLSKCSSRTGNSSMSSHSKTRRTNPNSDKDIDDKKRRTQEKENGIQKPANSIYKEVKSSNRNDENDSDNETVSHSSSNDQSEEETSCKGYRITRASYNKNQGQTQKPTSGTKKRNPRRNLNQRDNKKSNRGSSARSKSRNSNKIHQRNRNTKQSNDNRTPSKSSNYKSKETKEEEEKRQTRSRSPITIMKNPPEKNTSSKSSMRVKDSSPNDRNSSTPKPSPERDRNIPFDDLHESGTPREPSHSSDKYSTPSTSRRSSRPRERQRRSDRSHSPHRKYRKESSSRDRSESSRRGSHVPRSSRKKNPKK